MVIQTGFCTEGHIMIYLLITLHAHVRAGVMCSGLVSIYIYITKKKFEWHFSSPLTFSNTRGRLLVEFID